MNPWLTFILGLLVGWLIEWLIDFFYWRKRTVVQNQVAQATPPKAEKSTPIKAAEPQPATPVVPDDLAVIKGIGPVIAKKLNQAGIMTFEQLGNLTPADLEQILGNEIKRLANEDSLLKQARELAHKK